MSTPANDFGARTLSIKSDLVGQGNRVLAMLEASIESLFAMDIDAAKAATQRDDEVDKIDVFIEQQSVALLQDATRCGAELDPKQLREVLTIVKANNEFERIADVAVDLAELVPAIARCTAGKVPFPETFRVMANSVIGILRDTTQSVRQSDPALAHIVLQSQHAVTAFKGAVLREAEQKVAKSMLSVDVAFHLHEVASLCELIADHCTNIAEQVIYLTTGAIVRHAETKWVEVGRPASAG